MGGERDVKYQEVYSFAIKRKNMRRKSNKCKHKL
jgi:hypothetical protein